MAGQSPKRGASVDAAALKRAREAKCWSQKELANKIGCNPRNVERAEAGERILLKTLQEIATALGVTPESLRLAESSAPLPIDRLHQLSGRRVLDFTGRDVELKHITDRLRGGDGSVGVSSALRGMGGIGKTATAVEACWEVKDNFPDAQLVLDLRGMSEQPMTPIEAMARIIRDFHPECDKLPDEEAALLPLYRGVLAGKKALVLLDNAKDEAQVRGLVSVPPPVAFVITSRNALALDCLDAIRLDVLPPDEAFTLLRSIVNAKGTDDELRAVVKLCGFLPLALRVAGHFLRLHEDRPLPNYIAALQDETTRLKRLGRKLGELEVEVVLALSARVLVRDNSPLAERWQLLSIFPADFDARAVAVVWNLKRGVEFDEGKGKDELSSLLEQSLVQYDPHTDRYALHDLMRPIARDTFGFVAGHSERASSTKRIAAAERRFAWHYESILAEANACFLRGHEDVLRGLKVFECELANIRRGQLWTARHRSADRVAAQLCRNYALRGGSVVHIRLPPAERIRWLEEAVPACHTLEDRRNEAALLGSLGIAWDQLGEAGKAIPFHERHLGLARELNDRKGESAALTHLGIAWTNLGQPRKAIPFHEQALTIAREIRHQRWEASSLSNLGWAWNTLGEVRKAISYYDQALTLARELGDRHGEGLTRMHLGIAWAKLRNLSQAVSFLEGALAIARDMGDRRTESSALGNLGCAYKNLGDLRRAMTFHEQQLEIDREVGDRRGEGTALGNIGNVYSARGEMLKAISFYQQGLAIARELNNKEEEARMLFNLSLVFNMIRRSTEAIDHAEQALQLYNELGSAYAKQVFSQLAQWRGETHS
jgi:tetratricopeptide (TPR) repeat protein/transcriptional regulator with XRE-family HTH domain